MIEATIFLGINILAVAIFGILACRHHDREQNGVDTDATT